MKSMTAFAQVSMETGAIKTHVEIRSYNSKALDVAMYLHRSCSCFEDPLRKLVAEHIARGRIELRFNVENRADDSIRFQVDDIRAKAYFTALTHLKDLLNIPSGVTLDQVLNQRDIIQPCEDDTQTQDIEPVIRDTVTAALVSLDQMRAQEGENLRADLESRLSLLETGLDRIQVLSETIPAMYRSRLLERISALTSGVEGFDPVRLSQEAALLADKSDISEEIVRARSHIKQFREIMDAAEPGGRKLNFMIQEFNREFNTMGSKSGNAKLSYIVVDLKSELEKIREQVQNIE
ncbi:MAG: YicC/YloC family endoribonuclease [Pseudomonadota bacterium]